MPELVPRSFLLSRVAALPVLGARVNDESRSRSPQRDGGLRLTITPFPHQVLATGAWPRVVKRLGVGRYDPGVGAGVGGGSAVGSGDFWGEAPAFVSGAPAGQPRHSPPLSSAAHWYRWAPHVAWLGRRLRASVGGLPRSRSGLLAASSCADPPAAGPGASPAEARRRPRAAAARPKPQPGGRMAGAQLGSQAVRQEECRRGGPGR